MINNKDIDDILEALEFWGFRSCPSYVVEHNKENYCEEFNGKCKVCWEYFLSNKDEQVTINSEKNKKTILDFYEQESYSINSSSTELDLTKEDYELIKKYVNNEIDFNKLIQEVNNCPLNSCYWCNDNCEECDIKKINKGDIETDCRECWKRCLEYSLKDDKIDIKIIQNECNHKDKDGNFTVEYCDMYERRWSDLECTQCGKYVNGFELYRNECEKEKK